VESRKVAQGLGLGRIGIYMADSVQVSCTTLIAAQPTIFVTACREKRHRRDETPSGSKLIHDSAQDPLGLETVDLENILNASC
jgi:hypothetical protein